MPPAIFLLSLPPGEWLRCRYQSTTIMKPATGRRIIRPATGRRALKALISFALVALTGCFGASAMRYDIQSYDNKAVVSSEQEMLLFNVGRLYSDQPPHFMMLSTVAQTRSFSAALSVQWSQLWNSLVTPSTGCRATGTVKDAGAFQAGPFTAAACGKPDRIQFVPANPGTRFRTAVRISPDRHIHIVS